MNTHRPTLLNNSLLYFTLFILISYTIQNFFWGKHFYIGIPHYDGNIYGAYSKDFFHQLFSAHEFYHTHRILPSFIIFVVAKVLHIPLNSAHAVDNLFYFLNNFLFLEIVILWHQICNLKEMNRNIYLLGIMAIFANMFYLYYTQLVPALTDVSAFFLGFLILYAYLNKNKWLLIIATFLCCFTWPIAIAVAAPLFIYSNKNTLTETIFTNNKKLFYFLVLPAILLACAIFLYYLSISLISNADFYMQKWSHLAKAEYGHLKLIISTSILIAYLALIAYKSRIFQKLDNFLNVNYKNLLIYLAIVTISSGCVLYLEHQSHFYGHAIPVVTTKQFLAYMVFGAIAHPGFFIISNLIYYGPIFILILCFLDDFFEAANNEGFGMLLLAIISLVLAINPESRELTFSMPFLIYLTCAAMNKFEITISKLILFLCISLAVYHPLPTIFFYW